jgi:RHS repeat-associated protein
LDTTEAKGLNSIKVAGKELGRYLLGATPHDQNGYTIAYPYRSDLSTTEYVTRLYQTFLRRAPDSSLSNYVTQADAPNGRHTVLEQFLVMSAYSERSGSLYREIFWLVGDHLGTPRMIAERTGKLEGIKRNDYLPFGEQLQVGVGGRATTQGYVSESVRQGFVRYEEDIETGLSYAQARYMSSPQGRFISVDPLQASARQFMPQSWNRYTYTANNPLIRIDPDGRDWFLVNGHAEWHKGNKYSYSQTGKDGKRREVAAKNLGKYMIIFDKTGYDNETGAVVGTLTLYKQNQAIAQNPRAFSGGRSPNGTVYEEIPNRIYKIRTDIRNEAKDKNDLRPDGKELKPSYGLQTIGEATGRTGSWGYSRIYLNSEESAPRSERGNYIHSQDSRHGTYTGGCICDKNYSVLVPVFALPPSTGAISVEVKGSPIRHGKE